MVTDGRAATRDNRPMALHPFLRAALLGGLVAGTCDIVYAFIWLGQFGRSPLWVLQSVASGWLGRASFGGGWTSGAIGIASHYGISIVAAAVATIAQGFASHAILFGLPIAWFFSRAGSSPCSPAARFRTT